MLFPIHPLPMLPVLLLDYLWVIGVYTSFAFWLAVLIDGNLLASFDPQAARHESTVYLLLLVFVQLAVQGFIAIMIHSMLSFIPSPFQGIFGYDSQSISGEILRNPAIISVVLFFCSTSLQQRLLFVFQRYDKNAQGRFDEK